MDQNEQVFWGIIAGLFLGIIIGSLWTAIFFTWSYPGDSYSNNILCQHFIEQRAFMSPKNWIGNMTKFRCV